MNTATAEKYDESQEELNSLLDFLLKKHEGEFKRVFDDLLKSVKQHQRLLDALIENYVYQMAGNRIRTRVHVSRGQSVRGVQDAVSKGAFSPETPRPAELNRDQHIAVQKAANAAFVDHILSYPIFGGKPIRACTVVDLIKAEEGLEKQITGAHKHLRIVRTVKKYMPEKGTKRVDELNLPTEMFNELKKLFQES